MKVLCPAVYYDSTFEIGNPRSYYLAVTAVAAHTLSLSLYLVVARLQMHAWIRWVMGDQGGRCFRRCISISTDKNKIEGANLRLAAGGTIGDR